MMAINSLSEYGGFNYKVVDIPQVDLETVKKQDAALKAKEESLPEIPAVTEPKVPDTRSRMADLDDVSLTFNTGDDYSYIGSDFEIGSLDIEQAISDMKRDSILQDYQYFVGSTDGLAPSSANEDGKVFLKF